MRSQKETQDELNSFQDIWHGGFYAGDPRNPDFGLWGITSFLGVSHILYLACCKPNVDPSKVVLEIGCGRGAWSKLMLAAKHLYCIDALSAEHNGFLKYVGEHSNVEYIQASDFSLKEIPHDSIDFSYSYDALCHVSFAGISEYAESLFPRLRKGGHAIWMVADYEKYQNFYDNVVQLSPLNTFLPKARYAFLQPIFRFVIRAITKWNVRKYIARTPDMSEDDKPSPGRWYHAGTKRTCEMLQALGYTILDSDMGFDRRSPIIHFCK